MIQQNLAGPAVRGVYAYPRLSKTDLWFMRIGGDGLGNLLFNWARCLAASRRQGWPMVWPTWKSYKPKNKRVNPYDHRVYADLFQPTGDYLHGWRKAAVLASRRWIGEADAAEVPPARRCVVQFRGMGGKFEPFLDQLELIRAELLAMTRKPHLAGYAPDPKAPIGIHVRRGDFVWQPDVETMVEKDNSALPIEWYAATLQAVRECIGKPVPARVFSDGTDDELARLVGMPAVRRVEFGSSLADLLALSRCSLIIASGSTFSMWASYLHQVPTIWHPGKLLQKVHLVDRGQEVEWYPGRDLPGWLGEVLSGAATARVQSGQAT